MCVCVCVRVCVCVCVCCVFEREERRGFCLPMAGQLLLLPLKPVHEALKRNQSVWPAAGHVSDYNLRYAIPLMSFSRVNRYIIQICSSSAFGRINIKPWFACKSPTTLLNWLLRPCDVSSVSATHTRKMLTATRDDVVFTDIYDR